MHFHPELQAVFTRLKNCSHKISEWFYQNSLKSNIGNYNVITNTEFHERIQINDTPAARVNRGKLPITHVDG